MKTGVGNVKQLEGFDPPLFRFRVGAWLLIYRKQGDDAIEVVRVRNRREACRCAGSAHHGQGPAERNRGGRDEYGQEKEAGTSVTSWNSRRPAAVR